MTTRSLSSIQRESITTEGEGPAAHRQILLEHSLSTLVTGMALLLGASIIHRLVGFARATLFCRWLDASQLGLWDMAFGFLMTATPLVVLALPACLGRYVEYYRQRQMLGVFLRKTAALSIVLALLGATLMVVCASPLAKLLFGDAQYRPLVYDLAAAVFAVAIFNYLYELALALRLNRWISTIQLLNSLLFAGLGLGMLILVRNDAQTVILAYAIACALTAGVAVVGIKPWRFLASEKPALKLDEPFWSKILQYSLWIWSAGAISNLFAVVDRYMVLHWLPRTLGDPLAVLGDYHASRLVPMLFVSLTGLLASMTTPHLSSLWEQRHFRQASEQLNLLTKVLSFSMLCGCGAVLLTRSFLFDTLLAGKYPMAVNILPGTLAYCFCFSLFLLLQNYLFCHEQAYYAGLALACGLTINVILNFLWLPIWGLFGTVTATFVANVVALLVLLTMNFRLGQPIDVGLLTAVAAPVAVALGAPATVTAMIVIGFLIVRTEMYFTTAEKNQLMGLLPQFLSYIRLKKTETAASPAPPLSPEGQPQLASADSPTLAAGEPFVPQRRQPSFSRDQSYLGSENYREPAQVPRNVPPGRAGPNPFFRRSEHPPLDRRGPLRVMFVITCMPVGGAERLLVDIVRRLDRKIFAPELCCLKYLGPLGELLAREIPTFTGLLAHKYDVRVLARLYRLLRCRKIDAVITVGTGGDKMFWGRLAAYFAGVPVIASALHSTGLPDRVERLNRLLTPITDAFIAVSPPHANYIIEHEGCPPDRTWIVPNGIDTARFSPRPARADLRAEWGLQAHHRVIALVAALRPEKNHELLIQAAPTILREVPETRFLIVGDGPRREELRQLVRVLGLEGVVIFTGNREDVPDVLACADVVVLCSHMEANPLSVLEALACEKPVVATAVGSVPLHVQDGVTGFLVPPGDPGALAEKCLILLRDRHLAEQMGHAGRRHVLRHGTLDATVAGYERLIMTIYTRKCGGELPYPPRITPSTPPAEITHIPGLACPDKGLSILDSFYSAQVR